MDYLQPYLMLSSILFSMGIYAVITRKNAVAILMGIELILNACNINFVAFNRFGNFATLDGNLGKTVTGKLCTGIPNYRYTELPVYRITGIPVRKIPVDPS